jgi:hypothetical protein
MFSAKFKCRVVSKTEVTQTVYGSMFSAIIMDETAVIRLVCWGTALCQMFYDNFKVSVCSKNFYVLIKIVSYKSILFRWTKSTTSIKLELKQQLRLHTHGLQTHPKLL